MTLWSKIKQRPYLSSGGLILLIVLALVIFWPRTEAVGELIPVARTTVAQRVVVSGEVAAARRVDLAFSVAGTVRTIARQAGEQAPAGQLLAALDLGTLPAERAAAVAALRIAEAGQVNTSVNLEEVTAQYDTIVENARHALFSADLEAVPQDEDSTLTPPTVSGLYLGEAGEYKFRVRRLNATSPDYYLYTFGFDARERVKIDETRGTPLGSSGLLVRFSDELADYEDTGWFVRVPNEEGENYPANHAAYEKAKRDRQVAIENARAELAAVAPGASVAEAEIDQARAEVARIDALIADRELRAPFAGLIGKVDLELGQTVGASEAVISLLSDGQYEVTARVPEAEIAKVRLGDQATVSFDSSPQAAGWPAAVAAIDPAETIIDGVSTYEITLRFAEAVPQIRSGLSATVTIAAERRENVLAIPERALTFRDGQYFVQVLTSAGRNPGTAERAVTLGLRGDGGQAEILSGLTEGETVVIAPPAA